MVFLMSAWLSRISRGRMRLLFDCLTLGMDGIDLARAIGRDKQRDTAGPPVNGALVSDEKADSTTAVLDEDVIADLEKLGVQVLPELLALYFRQTPGEISELRKAVGGDDAATVASLMHKLKGSSSSVGAAQLSRVAGEIEACAKDRGLSNVQRLLQELDSALEDTEAAFRLRDAGPPEPSSPPHQVAPAPNGPLILVAEDSDTIRAVLMAQLTDNGCRVVTATNGSEALDRLTQDRPDVALLDIDMPEVDGMGVLDIVVRDPELAVIPVVFLTSRATSEDVAEGLRRGAHDYLRKPVDSGELTARLRAALRTKELADELRARNTELERLATTDDLTGLYNRRFLARELDRLIQRARRHGHLLSVAMLDIDEFKSINDHHGHAAGDSVLVELAARIQRRLRGDDMVARWGGEEFLLVLPETPPEGTAVVAESVRVAIGDEPFLLSGGALEVTASLGWATWQSIDSSDDLLRRADLALYAAKAAGRDTVRPISSAARLILPEVRQ